jgi:hypothetical protein
MRLPKRFERPLAVFVFLAICSSGVVRPALAGPAARGGTEPPPYPPTERYESRRIEGWPVLVSLDLIQKEPELAERTLRLLRAQLYQVARRVPAKALERLRTIRIWVEERESHTPCMAYHPNATWLREHGMNPEKAHCVELANARNFLAWTREQPWMVLHELSHGYHHQFLDQGFDNAEIKATFEQAKAAKLYESVLRINGQDDKAYAATDPMEYFAETSEAFFGTNDFYPYVRSELRRHDPRMFGLLETLWGSE